MKNQLAKAVTKVEKFVSENPVATLTVAVAIVVVFSLLLLRP